MVEVVIIGQNEGKHVDRMVDGIPKEWKIHYIADRCTDRTIELLLLQDREIDVYATEGLQGRQTSHCRNLGLSRCSSDSDVLFFDGDRYPVLGFLDDAYRKMSTDILLLPLVEDFRRPADFKANYGSVYNGFFSCGLFLRRSAINSLLDFQGGFLFDEELQTDWGIEDTYLGDVCYCLGLSAELSWECFLRGRFERNSVDSLDVIARRLNKRNKLLNVKW